MFYLIHHIKILFLLAATFLLSACGDNSIESQATPLAAPSSPTENLTDETKNLQPADSILYLDEIYSNDDVLTEGDYKIEKRSKNIWLKEAEMNAEVTFAVLSHKNKIIKTFEGVRYPLGNDARFGLFNILGKDAKQLIIEQEAHRTWHHWVVNLAPKSEIIYDSGDYSVGGSLRAVDIDKDGRYELIQSLLSFWFWGRLSNVDSPFIEIVFKFDSARQKFVPANPQFQQFVLRDIDDGIEKVKRIKAATNAPGQDGGKLGAVLQVLLTYLYAGREDEAWAFYENEYNLPDKDSLKEEIKKKVIEDAVYKIIKNKSTKRNGEKSFK